MKRDISHVEPVTVSIAEAAELTGLSIPVMTELVNREGFPAFYVGKRRLIPLDCLREWARVESAWVNKQE